MMLPILPKAMDFRNTTSMNPRLTKCQHHFALSKATSKRLTDSRNLISSSDQTVVLIGPKYYMGSSGSIWASDYMSLSHEYPTQSTVMHSQALQKFAYCIHDTQIFCILYMVYFHYYVCYTYKQ